MIMTIHGNMTPMPPVGPGSAGTPAQAPAPTQAPAAADTKAPAGVTPELWSTLSAEEQAFFSAAPLRGPLVYGPQSAPAADQAAALGQRLDVRA